MLLKQNMSAYTQTSYVYTTLSQHLRSFRFFLFVFFTYAHSCARLVLMQSFLSISFLFACLYALRFSYTHPHTYAHIHTESICACLCVSQFRFLSSHFFYSLHTTMVTLEMRDEILLKKKEECTYMHVVIHSHRQRTFAVLYVFLSVQHFIQGHNTDRNRSINRIVCIQIYSIRQTRKKLPVGIKLDITFLPLLLNSFRRRKRYS